MARLRPSPSLRVEARPAEKAARTVWATGGLVLRVLGVAVLSLACGEETLSRARLDIPQLSGSHAVAGAAPSGRSVDPRLVVRIPLSGRAVFEPPEFPGDVLDAFVGGLEDDDLPEGLTVDMLSFVAAGTEGSRPLLTFREPHVLARPAVSEDLSGFVPLMSATVGATERLEREDRYDGLVAGVSLRRPCVGDPERVAVFTPQLPTESWGAGRADPDGVRLGLVASGTVAWARIDPRTREVRLESAQAPADILVPGGIRFVVRSLGPLNARWRRPEWLVVDGGGGFEQLAFALRLDALRGDYVDDTPLLEEAPVRSLRGRVELELEEGPHTCVFGTVRSPNLDGGLWCRTQTSTVWRTELRLSQARAIVAVYPGGPGAALAVDRRGSIYRRSSVGWQPVATPQVNVGCSSLCVPFDLSIEGLGRVLIAGEDAQLLALDIQDSTSPPMPLAALSRASFSDERPGGARAFTFLAANTDSGGIWWFGTASGEVFRGDSDLQRFEALCLPSDAGDRAVVSVTPTPDGELVLGLAGGVLAVARWD